MKIYPFTNENVQSYNKLYKFEGSKVLSVVGSGDQYFASILNGAKEVDLFDKNEYALYYFILKFIAIRTLTYEDFWDYMIINMNNLQHNRILFEKIKTSLPKKVQIFFKKLFFSDNTPMSDLFVMANMYDINFFYKKHYNNGELIPYFDKNEYYRLQNLLREKRAFPNIYQQNFFSFNDEIKNEEYDLILGSNIMTWMYGNCPNEPDMQDYLEIIEKLNFKELQANYIWRIEENTLDISRPIYKQYGFIPDYVPSAKERKESDCVLSLRRVK